MIRNLKALVLALVAIGALGAVAASGASAASFRSESAPTIVTAEHDPGAPLTTFGTKASTLSVTCKKETFAGTASETSVPSLTVHPLYSECEAFGGAATVTTDGCDYVLYAETTSHANTSGGNEIDAPAEVECTAGSLIKIVGSGCTIKIGSQPKLHGVTYVNLGAGSTRDITVKITVDGISYTTEGFACPFVGLPKEGKDGTLTGSATAKGFVDTKFVKDAVTHKITATEGAQVGIWKE